MAMSHPDSIIKRGGVPLVCLSIHYNTMFDIRLATEDDIEESARVLAAAYTEDEQDVYLFPKLHDFPERYVNTKKSILRQGFSDLTCFTYVATNVVEAEGLRKIVGVCIWYRDDEGADGLHRSWLAKSIQSTRRHTSLEVAEAGLT